MAEDGTTLTLPCGHVFHGSCVEGLRAHGVAKVCPLCRGDLLAGPNQLFEEATRRYVVVEARIRRGKTSWAALPAADQREMKQVLQLWKDAAAQGSENSMFNLGVMYKTGQGVQQNYAEAVKCFRRAADQGHANAQHNMGAMYANGQGVQDVSEAVFWLEKAAFQNFNPAKLVLEQLRSYQARTPSSDSPRSSSDARGTCGHCGASGTPLKACSGCSIVLYCGRDCQVAHWKAGHKKDCKARKGT